MNTVVMDSDRSPISLVEIDQWIQDAEIRRGPATDGVTFTERAFPRRTHHITIEDWSQTGRGSHVDFESEETVPLHQGRYLGRGSMGDVHEVTIKGWKLAHKTINFRRKIGDREKREIEILKRLSHIHMVQLVGTYTKQKLVGMLLYPVAICDLHDFFEDVEAWTSTDSESANKQARLTSLEDEHKERLTTLGYDFPTETPFSSASLIYSKIGCLTSAVAYLHDQKIRHQDLKPSNILLGRDHLWLSDFGSATDFTLLSQSATDNERGTPRYFSPEMSDFKPTGRASDMFSLGCVLLEIMVLHRMGSLEHIRQNRCSDSAFHANLDKISTWLNWCDTKISPAEYILQWEIKSMLSKDLEQRPTAAQLQVSLASSDTMRRDRSQLSIFGDCCKASTIPQQRQQEQRSGWFGYLSKSQRRGNATGENSRSSHSKQEVYEEIEVRDQRINKLQKDIHRLSKAHAAEGDALRRELHRLEYVNGALQKELHARNIPASEINI